MFGGMAEGSKVNAKFEVKKKFFVCLKNFMLSLNKINNGRQKFK